MSGDNRIEVLADQLDSGAIGRREFLRRGLLMGMSVGALGAILSACARDEVAEGDGERSDTDTRVIRALGLGVVFQDAQLEKFTEDTGYEVDVTLDTLTGMLTKMLTQPDQYDIVDQNASYLEPMVRAGVIQPVPVDQIPNWEFARDLFTDENAPGATAGWPISQVYSDESRNEFKAVPSFFNYEAMGYNADRVDNVTSYDALFDEQYAGGVAIWNDAVWTIGMTALYLSSAGEMSVGDLGNLTQEEVDQVIQFLRQKKGAGQFRGIWSDYGQIVNLMASGEVQISDGWNPAFEDAKRQSGADLQYINPAEGNRPWFHTIAVSSEARNLEGAYALANWRLDGWFGAQIAPLGYYSPSTKVEEEMPAEDYEAWYGHGRDAGSYEERTANVAYWPGYPEEIDYYLTSWNAFLAS
jgi:putative spermidine/putrescine transport system substrate-binding protein